MTGFGEGDAAASDGARVHIEVRAVNSRHLDVRVRAPNADLAFVLEQRARNTFDRGRLDLALTIQRSTEPEAELDRAKARALHRALLELRDEVAPGEHVPFAMLGSFAEWLRSETERSRESPSDIQVAIDSALAQANLALLAMQEREGLALRTDLEARLDALRETHRLLKERSEIARTNNVEALRARIASFGLPIDVPRFGAEIIAAVARADVTEELVRFESHLEQLARTFGDTGAIGKRIDFLLQELLREANTIGSKSEDAAMTHAIVDAKSEIERMREQAQNVV